ncbi:unnamed protein product [Rotaria sordida]|uniref:Uncharacterized protein n=2 Tax=Rotaria sordida TaxID=392033 RepID=A0A814JGP4_9BILA|nr:unnamed protein product [Rotaria sordida]CAF1183525.1 unnamed protein product [Rotaria sordida]
MDDPLEELHRIGDKAIGNLRSAEFSQEFANVENLKKKITSIQLYQDVTIGHMIKNLPPDQLNKLNNGAERSHYRKRNIQIGVPCSLNAFYTYNNAQELIHSTSAEQFGHKIFPQLFNDNQNNTTIPHVEITDPLSNPWLRGARVIKAAAHPAQRQQQPFSSRNTEQQEASISTNTEQQQNQAVATVPANTGICSASMQN